MTSPDVSNGSIRRRSKPLWFVIGMVAIPAACVVVVLALSLWGGERMAELTEEALATAEEKWDAAGPASYDLELKVEGTWPGIVQMKVRDGQVTEFQRNGSTPSERRTWSAWTVLEQFDMIARDLEVSADPPGEIGASSGTQWILRAEFHPRLGYPIRYRRMVVGTGPDAAWEVVRFVARP